MIYRLVLCTLLLTCFSFVCAEAQENRVATVFKDRQPLLFDHSGVLKSKRASVTKQRERTVIKRSLPHEKDFFLNRISASNKVVDYFVQREMSHGGMSPFPSVNKEGLSNLNRVYPADISADVSEDYFYQITNNSLAIYNKLGVLIFGPVDHSIVWDGFISQEEGSSYGAMEVMFDRHANRWVVMTVLHNPGLRNKDCLLMAVSETSDPLGSYYRYAFELDSDMTSPKLSRWGEQYVVTSNNFQKEKTAQEKGAYLGSGVIVFERKKLLDGSLSARGLYFQLAESYFNLNAPHYIVDRDKIPSSGYLLHMSHSGYPEIQILEMIVNWSNVTRSEIKIVQKMLPKIFCSVSDGVPQPNSVTKLASFCGELVSAIQYRYINDSASLLFCHGVTVNGVNGIRWYEIRETAKEWFFYQQQTFAPNDGVHRWLGSIAMNGNGDIALGYSASNGKDIFPSLRYIMHSAQGEKNVMNISEVAVVKGKSSQHDIEAWGSAILMIPDPSDDASFWFTGPYMDGDWKTRVVKFNLASSSDLSVFAGIDTVICGNDVYKTLSARIKNVNEVSWSTSGTGTFLPGNQQLNCEYIRSNEDVLDGGVWLKLKGKGFGGRVVEDSLFLKIKRQIVLKTVKNDTIIKGSQYKAVPAVFHHDKIVWTTNGDGKFADPYKKETVYIPGKRDREKNGVVLTIEASSLVSCIHSQVDSIFLHFKSAPKRPLPKKSEEKKETKTPKKEETKTPNKEESVTLPIESSPKKRDDEKSSSKTDPISATTISSSDLEKKVGIEKEISEEEMRTEPKNKRSDENPKEDSKKAKPPVNKGAKLLISPNPSSGKFSVTMNEINEDEVILTVLNSNGKIEIEELIEVEGGRFKQSYNLTALNRGDYRITVKVRDRIFKSRLVLH